jgi:hypothetical protein
VHVPLPLQHLNTTAAHAGANESVIAHAIVTGAVTGVVVAVVVAAGWTVTASVTTRASWEGCALTPTGARFWCVAANGAAARVVGSDVMCASIRSCVCVYVHTGVVVVLLPHREHASAAV